MHGGVTKETPGRLTVIGLGSKNIVSFFHMLIQIFRLSVKAHILFLIKKKFCIETF